MLKNISNLGKTLNKAEQKTISGGKRPSIQTGDAYMICQDGTEVQATSCSEWAIDHFCGSHGGLRICVGED